MRRAEGDGGGGGGGRLTFPPKNEVFGLAEDPDERVRLENGGGLRTCGGGGVSGIAWRD